MAAKKRLLITGNIALLLFLILLLSGCVPLGDAGVIVKGQLLTVDSEPHIDCHIIGSQGEEIIYEKDIGGIFETTIVFAPAPDKPLQLEMSCVNATNKHVYVIKHKPKPFGEILDVGRIVLE